MLLITNPYCDLDREFTLKLLNTVLTTSLYLNLIFIWQHREVPRNIRSEKVEKSWNIWEKMVYRKFNHLPQVNFIHDFNSTGFVALRGTHSQQNCTNIHTYNWIRIHSQLHRRKITRLPSNLLINNIFHT